MTHDPATTILSLLASETSLPDLNAACSASIAAVPDEANTIWSISGSSANVFSQDGPENAVTDPSDSSSDLSLDLSSKAASLDAR